MGSRSEEETGSGSERSLGSAEREEEGLVVSDGEVLILLNRPMQSIYSLVHSGLEGFTSSRWIMARGNEQVIWHLKCNRQLSSENVEMAFRYCPRDIFVPDSLKSKSYEMHPLRLDEYKFNISAPEVYANALEELRIQEGDRFLDIGSGCGHLTAMGAYLAGKSGTAIGVDLFERTVNFSRSNVEALKEARPEYASRACEVEFMVCNVFMLDVDALPSPDGDGRFDKIHCGATCPGPRIRELAALLKPGGRLVTPSGKSMFLVKKKKDGSLYHKPVAAVRYGDLIVPDDLELIMHQYNRYVSKASRLQTTESCMEQDFKEMMTISTVKEMFLSSESSDFSFVVQENGNDIRIPTHKAVLSARSGHFKALFNSSMKDSASEETRPPEEFSKGTLMECLRYMYTDEASVDEDNCVQLLKLSKYYDVSPGIFELCEGFLRHNLDTSNAASMLHLSNWYSCDSLKRSTIQFILDNLDEVRQTEDWQQLDRDVVEEVLVESFKRSSLMTQLVDKTARNLSPSDSQIDIKDL